MVDLWLYFIVPSLFSGSFSLDALDAFVFCLLFFLREGKETPPSVDHGSTDRTPLTKLLKLVKSVMVGSHKPKGLGSTRESDQVLTCGGHSFRRYRDDGCLGRVHQLESTKLCPDVVWSGSGRQTRDENHLSREWFWL